jgi:hypothetical protein
VHGDGLLAHILAVGASAGDGTHRTSFTEGVRAMSVGAWTFYNTFRKKLGKKIIDLSADAFMIALFKSTSNAATLTLSTLGLGDERDQRHRRLCAASAAGRCSTASGRSAPRRKQFKFYASAPIFTASGASLNNIKFAVLHDNTVGASAGLRPLVAFCQLSTAQFTISNPATRSAIVNPATGIFTLA